MELLAALGSIAFINLILSGDNAVVIALASRNLPQAQRKKAILWGSLGAVALRIGLTFLAAMLLKIPFVQSAGGLALLYIASDLLVDKNEKVDCKEAATLSEAIKTILLADVIMSLDNVLAIAGIAGGNFTLLVFGLALSIPIVVLGSQMLMTLMDKFPFIVYAGTAILGWTAAKMIVSDGAFRTLLTPYALFIEIALTLIVLVYGHIKKVRSRAQEAHTPSH